MATRMTSQTYAPHRNSPYMQTGVHNIGYNGSWKEIKSELDIGGYQSDGSNYGQNTYQSSPQSLPSCMFSSHTVSPSILQQLPFSERSHHFMAGSKENGFFRDVPPCRRRLDFNHNAFVDLSKPVPVAVAKRNERERNRVKLINMTFQTLRQHLPVPGRGSKGKTRKLSKVQTLRSAIDYIRNLEDLISTKKHDRGGCASTKAAAKFLREQATSAAADEKDGDRVPMSLPKFSDSYSSYGSLYKPQVASPGDNSHGEFYGADNGVSSSPENHCSTYSSTSHRHEDASPLSETSSYEVVAADDDDDEFLDFDFWF